MAHFEATADALGAVLAYVEARCEDLGATRSAGLRAALVIEELFLNAVLHGGAATPVRIELETAGGELIVEIEDTGIPFDPFMHLDLSAHHKPLEERPVGGLGVVLVDGFARRRDYCRENDRNRVRIWLAREVE